MIDNPFEAMVLYSAIDGNELAGRSVWALRYLGANTHVYFAFSQRSLSSTFFFRRDRGLRIIDEFLPS